MGGYEIVLDSTMVIAVGRSICGEEILALSAGHASFPEDGIDAEKLLAAADKRMYQVKQAHHRDPRYSRSLPEEGRTAALIS